MVIGAKGRGAGLQLARGGVFPICSGVEPLDLAPLSRSELTALGEAQGAEPLALKAVVAELRAEIARLKGTPRRPTLKPSGMDKATDGAPSRPGGGRRGPTKAKLVIDEERVLPAPAPAGSRFKGYEEFVVQDLVVCPHVVRFQRERRVLADGGSVTAPLPAGIDGHFGLRPRPQALRGGALPSGLSHRGASDHPAPGHRRAHFQASGAAPAARSWRGAVRHAGVSSAQWLSVDETSIVVCNQTGSKPGRWKWGSKSRSDHGRKVAPRPCHTPRRGEQCVSWRLL
jgi:hypothetical protein